MEGDGLQKFYKGKQSGILLQTLWKHPETGRYKSSSSARR